MELRRVLSVVWGNIRRNKRAFILSSVGIIVGVATLTFFVALGMGIQAGVLNRIYPVNQIEVEPATVGVVGLREAVVDPALLGPRMVDTLRSLPDVTAVYPKMRSRLQARLWGGKTMFGYNMRTEAFFDGLDPELLQEDLQQTERVEDKRRRAALRKRGACKKDEECPLGQECGEDGLCGRIEYWRRFEAPSLAIPCEEEGSDEHCLAGQRCLGGLCRTPCEGGAACDEGSSCAPQPGCEGEGCPQVCLPDCASDADCDEASVCDALPGGGHGCVRLPCTVGQKDRQYSDSPRDLAGTVTGRCANGVPYGSATCEPMTCPDDTYCAVRDTTVAEGYCEKPLPVLLNPFLIEVFNSSVASSLGLQPLDGVEAILGISFRMHFGGSYFTGDLAKNVQAVKLAQVVGFSQKALEFGVTLPIDTVRALNTRYKGRDSARTYDTFILETEGNEDVSALIGELEERGLSLSSRSQDARKAADLLFILTVVFSFISVVIMGVAAVNITHTFLTIITERRHEIGIMRAIGATRADVRRVVLVEAAAIGVFGTLAGTLLGFGFSRLVNAAAARYLEGIPFKPDDFFHFDWRIFAGALVFALIFCLLGAFVPAQRAASLDPARVLVS
ncbi:MAG: FtsX-like permease family protein [Deltaproteobacteria bacterium]|nr:FtsX-like permease family protein [Deltaproteobacteria bacterium]MCB9786995.1 FtsX-like permease family protein [Deltaproteobacteria bacterium]